MRRPITLLAAAAALSGPATAGAAPAAQPLVDLPPQVTSFRDHVGPVRAQLRAVRYSPAALTATVTYAG